MAAYQYITLREKPELMDPAAQWFHRKWGVPTEAYLECMEAYLKQETELGWFLCLDGEKIVGGLGVIENDFHDRKDLTPNVCAVYTEEGCPFAGVMLRPDTLPTSIELGEVTAPRLTLSASIATTEPVISSFFTVP